MIRVQLPAPLLALARLEGELAIDIDGPASPALVLDAIEARYPMLRGTVRDGVTGKRRAFVRYYACERDISHDPATTPFPPAVQRGEEPFLVIGAMSGG
ncbi:MAG: MoaD/ThiS family protein [Gemmatimonadota bacterium]